MISTFASQPHPRELTSQLANIMQLLVLRRDKKKKKKL